MPPVKLDNPRHITYIIVILRVTTEGLKCEHQNKLRCHCWIVKRSIIKPIVKSQSQLLSQFKIEQNYITKI